MNAGFLAIVEGKTKHIALSDMIIVQIIGQLLLTAPYLHFDYKLLAEIINDDICSAAAAPCCLYYSTMSALNQVG